MRPELGQPYELTHGKPTLTPLETAIGLRGMLRWRLHHNQSKSDGVNPLPRIKAEYGHNFQHFTDALPFMERQVTIEQELARLRAAEWREAG